MKALDKASPKLFEAAAQGKSGAVQIELWRMAQDDLRCDLRARLRASADPRR